MSVIDTKHSIRTALGSFRSGNLSRNAINLFKVLGYNTERQAPFEKQNYDSFKSSFVEGNSRFNEEKAMVAEWKYIDLLFQISLEEITKQYSAFKKEVVAKEDGSKIAIESFLFFAIELKSETYSRSALSHITREVNKLFPMPAIVLFKQGLSLTLAVINRRLHKRDERKDVLEKVTFIKDINIERPHRAHIEILFDLSFEKLLGVYKFTNFVELHSSWQKTLDTKELNNKFYKELSNWYFWAMEEVYFPGAGLHADENSLFKKEDKEKEHNATNLIRLLTRLLFVWFIKEKGLIPEEFFDEKYVADELLINFKPKKNRDGSLPTVSCYYRAILQNLFFATLNQNMGKREFRRPGQHMNVTNLLRYERYFKDPNKYIKLVEKTTPFMNGGLFECLDIPDSEKRGRQGGDVIIYQDGFSDRDDNQLKVPDYIFFGTEDHADLSEAYGDKDKEYKNAAIKGLINILKSYKFTVAENTPLEEEVALDPELLGRVFENLLASYNPETKTTARKQTGSFYTPREIVNYMVDESLIAYLNQKLIEAGVKEKEESLRDLISYSENFNPFNAKEATLLIDAIDSCKILDPACGSGAFPMGILHKLVHILHKLDSRNKLWEQKQIEKARAQDDPAIRDQLIADIEAAFENNELDYGRKLYLIENCIYGVDIQPIATQISKLRFFISLIVDQKVNEKKENFGIRPLPNLETKFVAANALIGIEKPEAQMSFGSAEVKALEEKLKDIRHRLFSAKTPATKRKLREEDKLIREKMGNVLNEGGWENDTAHKLASWDPYDQDTSSSFFDPEWMFGIMEGFDIVIGNPPYIRQELIKNIKPNLKKYYSVFNSTSDLYTYFYELTYKVLRDGGISTFITNNSWIKAKYGQKLREFFLRNTEIIHLLNFEDELHFDSAIVETNVLIFKRAKPLPKHVVYYSTTIPEKLSHYHFIPQNALNAEGFTLENPIVLNLKNKIESQGVSLKSWDVSINRGILTGFNEAFYIDETTKNEFIKQEPHSMNIIKPILRGRDIKRFIVEKGDVWLINSHNGVKEKNIPRINIPKDYPVIYKHLKKYEKELTIRRDQGAHWTNLRDCAFLDQFDMEKVVWITLTDRAKFAFDDERYYTNDSTFLMTGRKLKYLLAILNSRLTEWFFNFIAPTSGMGTTMWKKAYIEKVPIVKTSIENEGLFENIVECIIQKKKQCKENPEVSFFEHLIDAMAYELYLPKEIKSAGCGVLKHLINLKELEDDWIDERKLSFIEKVYKELSDPKHSVSVAMSKMQEIEEVRIIEGKA